MRVSHFPTGRCFFLKGLSAVARYRPPYSYSILKSLNLRMPGPDKMYAPNSKQTTPDRTQHFVSHTDLLSRSPKALEKSLAGDSNDQSRARRRIEWSQKAILNGWFVSLLGIVGYCYATLSGPHQGGPLGALVDSGPVGWVATFFLVIGLALWVSGSLVYLVEAIDPSLDDVKEKL